MKSVIFRILFLIVILCNSCISMTSSSNEPFVENQYNYGDLGTEYRMLIKKYSDANTTKSLSIAFYERIDLPNTFVFRFERTISNAYINTNIRHFNSINWSGADKNLNDYLLSGKIGLRFGTNNVANTPIPDLYLENSTDIVMINTGNSIRETIIVNIDEELLLNIFSYNRLEFTLESNGRNENLYITIIGSEMENTRKKIFQFFEKYKNRL